MIGHYALTGSNCFVDSVDSIPQIPTRASQIRIISDGSNSSCDTARCLRDCYAKKIKSLLSDTQSCALYDRSRDEKVADNRPNKFFRNVQRAEPGESTYRKMESTDRMFLYVDLPAFRSRAQWNGKMYIRVCPEPGNKSVARGRKQRPCVPFGCGARRNFSPVQSNKRALRSIYLVIYLARM